jgi:hypothetical protein
MTAALAHHTLTPSDPVAVRVHTHDVRAYGRMHLVRSISTARALNRDDRPHLPLTDVDLYAGGLEHPPHPEKLLYRTHFLAVPKDAIVWLTGGRSEANENRLGLYPRPVFLIHPDLVLAGDLHVPSEARLSDFGAGRMRTDPFVTLHTARVLARGGYDVPLDALPAAQEHEFLVVNLRSPIGIVDHADGDPARAFDLE